jgi:hypothetical protein
LQAVPVTGLVKRKEPHIRFLYVISIIFMIYFAMNCLWGYPMFRSLFSPELGFSDAIRAIIIIKYVLAALLFVAMLLGLIYSGKLLGSRGMATGRAEVANKLRIVAIVAFALGIVCVVLDVVFYEILDAGALFDDYVGVVEAFASIFAVIFYLALTAYDWVFFGFVIPFASKASKYHKMILEQEQFPLQTNNTNI